MFCRTARSPRTRTSRSTTATIRSPTPRIHVTLCPRFGDTHFPGLIAGRGSSFREPSTSGFGGPRSSGQDGRFVPGTQGMSGLLESADSRAGCSQGRMGLGSTLGQIKPADFIVNEITFIVKKSHLLLRIHNRLTSLDIERHPWTGIVI